MPQQLSSRIAIVVPVFNTAKYLSECLDSIRAQTYSNFSVFLIDDGSTDDSPSICDRYANQDDRFHVLHKINGGVSTARNAALELIERKGGFDWIICLDSDDYLSNDALEMVSTRGAQLKADMLVFGVQRFSKDGFQVDGKKSHTTSFSIAKMLLDLVSIKCQNQGCPRRFLILSGILLFPPI